MQLESINGLGKKTIDYLNNMGINNIDDLITYYPYRYEMIKRSNISFLKDGDKIIIDGIIESSPTIYYYGKKRNVMNFRISAQNRILNVAIYNRGFLKTKIKVGKYISIIGKYMMQNNKVVATDIKFSLLPNHTTVDIIYHESSKINSKEIHNLINQVLPAYQVKDYLPDYIKEKYQFKKKLEALWEIHNPTSSANLKESINMLKYEELFIFMMRISKLKDSRERLDGIKRNISRKVIDGFIDKLPFKLTEDQQKCIDDIYLDMVNLKRMNRLVQGDVGSGKTIVAFIALYINYLSGYQGAFMAPTEVLAKQHYQNIKTYFNDIKIELLTGNTKNVDKRKLITKLKSGEIDILVGTHALFSDDVIYNNLGLVITDEQHRFGVNQRSLLKSKGLVPDVLYLSATPIPRTYALTIYGDMDISSIKTLPGEKKEIITMLKTNDDIKEVLTKMYQQIKLGHQVYVIAPLIEESCKVDLESADSLYDKMNRALGKVCKIGLMHGKLSKDEKDAIMQKFADGEVDVLVSTTVIEVGVDVKNATMIVIFDSYRFGLSTLHQLRGRVGRNELQSYCILISDKEADRLDIMTKTSDGFRISEEDFKLRGSGDLFGVKQSGDMNFKLADIKRDFSMLVKVKSDVEDCLSNDYVTDDLKDILKDNNSLD